jgi:actin related protein 2/3 complex subunit 5
MAQASPPSSKSTITPQATGFSQVHTRGGGEGGGQAMSVLLSWHEKVRTPCLPSRSCLRRFPRIGSAASAKLHHILTLSQLVEIAGPGSVVRVMTDRRTV